MIDRRSIIKSILFAPAILKSSGIMRVSTRLVKPIIVLARNELRHGFKIGVEQHGIVKNWSELLYGPEDDHPFDYAEVGWDEWGEKGMTAFKEDFKSPEYTSEEYQKLVEWWRNSKPKGFINDFT